MRLHKIGSLYFEPVHDRSWRYLGCLPRLSKYLPDESWSAIHQCAALDSIQRKSARPNPFTKQER
jgi:hypothetical protein